MYIYVPASESCKVPSEDKKMRPSLLSFVGHNFCNFMPDRHCLGYRAIRQRQLRETLQKLMYELL